MFKSINQFVNGSFPRKLVIYNIALVLITTLLLFGFLIYNMRSLTSFALQQNATAIDQTIEEYLTRSARENAVSTWLQLKAAQDNLSVIGRMAQSLIDMETVIEEDPSLFENPLFKTDLRDVEGSLSSAPDNLTDVLVQRPIVDSPRSMELVQLSSLLNLSLQAVFDGNTNNTFLYFVGDKEAPITRAYPNNQLATVLNDAGVIDLLFWQDYFPENVSGWEKWFNSPDLQKEIPSPLTMEPPYQDAAGQGLIMTMFYPLWDHEADQFAGVMGADIKLQNIIDNVLTIRLGETGFAFLMSETGDIIAMPEQGFEIFNVDLQTTEVGGLSYISGNILNVEDADVKAFAEYSISNDNGFYKYKVLENSTTEGYVIAFASLPTFYNAQYDQDNWRIAVIVPEAEIYQLLNETTVAIRDTSQQTILISIAIMIAFLAIAAMLALRFSSNITADIRKLAHATSRVSEKDYSVNFNLNSQDEIGQLGNVFKLMVNEIRDYTTNLEDKVKERTVDLQQANEVITSLNEKLKDENVRLGAELDIARQLQMMVLPSEIDTSRADTLDIATYMRPADEVGGDYYDVFRVGDDIYLGIGDVTGHGLSSGVVMLMVQTAVLALSQAGDKNTRQILSILNKVICQNIARIREDKNITISLIKYRDRQFSIVGQHESVIICRNDGTIEQIDTTNLGLPVGLIDDIDDFISTETFGLEAGEIALLYTDGITEAENPTKEQYGMDRMIKVLQIHHNADSNTIRDSIIKDVYAFIDSAEIYDDISMVVIKQQ